MCRFLKSSFWTLAFFSIMKVGCLIRNLRMKLWWDPVIGIRSEIWVAYSSFWALLCMDSPLPFPCSLNLDYEIDTSDFKAGFQTKRAGLLRESWCHSSETYQRKLIDIRAASDKNFSLFERKKLWVCVCVYEKPFWVYSISRSIHPNWMYSL